MAEAPSQRNAALSTAVAWAPVIMLALILAVNAAMGALFQNVICGLENGVRVCGGDRVPFAVRTLLLTCRLLTEISFGLSALLAVLRRLNRWGYIGVAVSAVVIAGVLAFVFFGHRP